MTRRGRIWRNVALSLVALLFLTAVATIKVVQTDWFRNYVREKIITETQDAIGGRAELKSFSFDWRHLEASIDQFVIHGNEPPYSAPFLQASQVTVRFRLFSSVRRILSVSFLGIEQPEVNVLVDKDGKTNIPTPASRQASESTPLETVVDLAISHFELNQGTIHFNSSVQPLDVQGNDLRIQLAYNLLKRTYEGHLALQPLYIVAGRNTPVAFTLDIPLTLGRDSISVQDATVRTALSALTISGSLDNLRQPKTSAHVIGQVSLSDLNNLGNLSLDVDPKGRLSTIVLDAKGDVSQDEIRIESAHIALGSSTVDAKGILKDPKSGGSLTFTSNVDLAEISRVTKSSQGLTGVVALDGRAGFKGDRIDFEQFHVRAFGGEAEGRASVEQLARYQISAKLSTFDLQATEQRLGMKPLPYSGRVSGTIEAKGDLTASRDIDATAVLNVAPGRAGIPVSGKINARYNGASGDISAGESNLRLPHSSLTFSGSLRAGLRVNITTRDLRDLLAAVPGAAESPTVRLNGGQAGIQAVVTGSVQNPSVTGQVTATRIVIEDRQFDSFATDFNAAKSRISVTNGTLSRGRMLTQFAGSAGLVDWSPAQTGPLVINATVMNGDLADMLALAGQPTSGYSGALTATINITGTIGNPAGSATVQASSGTVAGEPFDQAQARVIFSDQRVSLPAAFIVRDMARLDLSAEYTHSRDSLATGHLTAHVISNGVDLAQVRGLETQHPNTAGMLQVDATIAGDTSTPAGKTEFLITSVNGNVAARRLRVEGTDYGDLTATASTSGNTVNYNLTSNFAGSQIRADGRTQLILDYPTSLEANLSNLAIDRVLALVKRTDIPAKGIVSGTLHLSGTMKDPQGTGDLSVANAVFYDEPLDRVHARGEYLPKSIDITQLEITAGQSSVNLSVRFDHPVEDLEQGDLQFQIESSTIDLARLHTVQEQRPGLAGSLRISGSGKAALRPKPRTGSTDFADRIAFQDLNARVGATGLAAQGKNLGNLDLVATTSAGRLNFTLDSGIANASIQGRGNAQLSGDYPVSAELTFKDVTWANLQPLIASGEAPLFDASTSGQVALEGPLANLDQIKASIRLNTLQIRPLKQQTIGDQPATIQNQGDVAMNVENGLVRIESAHLVGPETDITATGTASLRDNTLNLRLNANANLSLLESLDAAVFSSGTVSLNMSVQGTAQNPVANGRLELRSASVSYAGLPAGIQNANGVVVFNGNSANIQSLTGESGGGKVSFSGFVTKANELRFSVRVNATGVRVRVQPGVSVVTTATLNLSGTAQKSLLSGTATIDRFTYLPQTDIGSLLTRSAPPVQAPTNPAALLANMNLDVLVRTSSATSVQANLAENLQATADLRIRGTAAQPGVIGSVQMNHGDLVFFGAKYRISSGTISFYNPNRIEPILELSLETQAKGVTVVLSVTGPVDNMKLSYTSDPPLQFEEIVTLLASGRPPTSDPTLLANQPSQPPQTFQERGESAILSKALADPLSNRLQRVFGVSQLKIDPSFTSGSQLPQARVTLQQQVATNLVFTYVTALDNPNSTVVRIEWSMTPQWSATANRDENGLFSVNLQYKKQFR